jgi:hypothetical protein
MAKRRNVMKWVKDNQNKLRRARRRRVSMSVERGVGLDTKWIKIHGWIVSQRVWENSLGMTYCEEAKSQ